MRNMVQVLLALGFVHVVCFGCSMGFAPKQPTPPSRSAYVPPPPSGPLGSTRRPAPSAGHRPGYSEALAKLQASHRSRMAKARNPNERRRLQREYDMNRKQLEAQFALPQTTATSPSGTVATAPSAQESSSGTTSAEDSAADSTTATSEPAAEAAATKTEASETAATTASPAPAESSSTVSKGRGTCFALVIGVGKYRDSRITPLRYARADAQAFYDWLVDPKGGAYPPSQVKLLLDEQATVTNIRDAFFEWLKKPIAEDQVLIYIACHGSPDSPANLKNLFLLPYDADYDKIASTAFPMWDIETALKRFVKAERVIIVADACHSAGVGASWDSTGVRDTRGIAGVKEVHGGLQSLSSVGKSTVVIAASDTEQLSQESEKWGGGHGVFTHYLLTGLKGEADYNEDGVVVLGELTQYVSEKVRRATGSSQCPTVSGRFDPMLKLKP